MYNRINNIKLFLIKCQAKLAKNTRLKTQN